MRRRPRRPSRRGSPSSRRTSRPSGAMSRSWKQKYGTPSLVEELEGRVELRARGDHRRQPRVEPGPVERPDAEHVGARPVERVPQADGDPEVVLHALAEDEPVRLVDLERERIGRIEPAEGDRPRHVREEVRRSRPTLRAPADPRGGSTRHAPRAYRMFVREEDKSRHARGGFGGSCGSQVVQDPRPRHAAASSRRRSGSPISIGLLTGSALHSNQPPSYTAIRGQSMQEGVEPGLGRRASRCRSRTRRACRG